MTRTSAQALAVAGPIIRLLTVLNLVYGVGITLLLVSSVFRPDWPWVPLGYDIHAAHPSLAFALSRIADQPTTPTPVGVFRAVNRPSYAEEMQRQLADASAKGSADPEELGEILGALTMDALEAWASGRSRKSLTAVLRFRYALVVDQYRTVPS